MNILTVSNYHPQVAYEFNEKQMPLPREEGHTPPDQGIKLSMTAMDWHHVPSDVMECILKKKVFNSNPIMTKFTLWKLLQDN